MKTVTWWLLSGCCFTRFSSPPITMDDALKCDWSLAESWAMASSSGVRRLSASLISSANESMRIATSRGSLSVPTRLRRMFAAVRESVPGLSGCNSLRSEALRLVSSCPVEIL